MPVSFFGLNNYSSLFSSPVPSYSNSNPLTNLIYKGISSQQYNNTVGKNVLATAGNCFSSLKNLATNMKQTSAKLDSSHDVSSLNKKAVASADSNAITGTASSNATDNTYTVKVAKIATAEVHKGTTLTSGNSSSINQGTNTFTINSGGKSKTLSINVDANETNQQSLTKMATSINEAKFGATATVVSDKATGSSYLSIKADKTGTDNQFTLADSGSGNAVAASGANTVNKAADNASYQIDGKSFTSQSNQVTADNGKVTFNLLKADNKDTKLTVSNDSTDIESQIKQLVSDYNQMVQFSAQNSFDTSKLDRGLSSAYKSNKGQLESMGITKSSDGTLKIDEKVLKNAVQNNLTNVQSALSDHGGFAKSLNNLAGKITNSPFQYMNPTKALTDLKGLYVDMTL